MVGEKKMIEEFLKTCEIDYNGSYKICPGDFLTMYNKYLRKKSKETPIKKKRPEYLYWDQ